MSTRGSQSMSVREWRLRKLPQLSRSGLLSLFFPMVGVHTAMAFILALVLRLNPLIVFLGTQISNPLTFPILLVVSAEAGHLLLHGSLVKITWSGKVDWMHSYIVPLLTGSLVLGVIVSAVSYVGAYSILRKRAK